MLLSLGERFILSWEGFRLCSRPWICIRSGQPIARVRSCDMIDPLTGMNSFVAAQPHPLITTLLAERFKLAEVLATTGHVLLGS